jgi:hypothetical protein
MKDHGGGKRHADHHKSKHKKQHPVSISGIFFHTPPFPQKMFQLEKELLTQLPPLLYFPPEKTGVFSFVNAYLLQLKAVIFCNLSFVKLSLVSFLL